MPVRRKVALQGTQERQRQGDQKKSHRCEAQLHAQQAEEPPSKGGRKGGQQPEAGMEEGGRDRKDPVVRDQSKEE